MRHLLVIILLCCSALPAIAQHPLKGKIMDEDSLPMPGVTILNKRTNSGTITDANGLFTITARPGDTLLIKMLGYLPLLYLYDRHQDWIIRYMKRNIIELNAINIIHYNFQRDSLRLRQEYAREFTYRPPHWDEVWDVKHLRPFAVNINNLFKATQFKTIHKKKHFRRVLLAKEEENYINQHFTIDMVSHVVPLSGDSLTLFMQRYRPGKAFLEGASTYDIYVYIKQRYQEFIHGTATIPK
ncbi:MAG: carboxypeptidase-like regulatory domain-containing protein [Chitinophaga sp.]|nr:carboxypeptidase-like regulatory domain-containing protein [Chitinophaga sp.]